jgi:beta-phosphoglucomutase-like phosphatase (HAD superfamily)
MKFKAVLFDFDGVIADTMNDNFLAWKKSFKKYNCNIKRKDYLPLEGMKLIKIAEVISKKYFLKDVSPKLLENLKNKHYKENHSFKFYAEIPKLIKDEKIKE